MAVLWRVAIPAIVVSHVIGIAFLIYGLNRLTGFVTKAWRKVYKVQPAPFSTSNDLEAAPGGDAQETDSDSLESKGDFSNAANFGSEKDCAPKPRPPRWVRHCECTGSCYCPNRWCPPGPVGGEGRVGLDGRTRHTSEDSGSMLGRPVTYAADLAWHRLAISVTDPDTLKVKQILYPSSGVVVPGEMCALVGPSGAGKSTLLDLLANYKKVGKVEGKIYMNGRSIGKRFKRVSAYVSQEDVFVPTMSAWETLRFHASLRLGNSLTATEQCDRMTDVLKIMGLWRSKDTQVGGYLPGGINVRGLSGGEKRRLTISCSLIARPSIIFLDEPTSGLDSFAALNVMDHLSQLASMGHTIIASIHQPREGIWNMFHKVAVLSEGTQVYFGPPDGASTWFTDELGYEYNAERDGAPSDWLIDLVAVGFKKPKEMAERSMTSREEVQEAAKKWAAWRDNHTEEGQMIKACFGNDLSAGNLAKLDGEPSSGMVKSASSVSLASGNDEPGGANDPKAIQSAKKWAKRRYAASWWTQFSLLTQRAIYTQLRNPADVVSRLALSTWVGIIAGLIAFDVPWDTINGGQRVVVQFFLIVVFMLLPFCYMSIYFSDRQFFRADIQAGLYHSSAYYLAQTVGSLPFIILNTLAGGFATHGLVGLRTGAAYMLMFAALIVLVSLCAIQVLVFCVYIAPTMDLAFVLACFYTSWGFLLCGFFLRVSLMKVLPMRWVSYLMFPRWAIIGLARVQLEGIHFYFPVGCDHGKPEIPKKAANTLLAADYIPGQCDVVGTGDWILNFWEFDLAPAICIAILIGFYLIMHVMSYLALVRMSRSKR